MSKIALSGNTLGTGTFTIASPNSNTDRTINLPNAGGDMVLTTATQTLTNKSIAATQLTGNVAAARITNALNASGSAPIYAARAWVNFDGTTTSPTIRASGNVSSVTRTAIGTFTVNFTTAMPDADYCISGISTSTSTTNSHQVNLANGATPSTSSVQIQVINQAGNRSNTPYVFVKITR
jgi:hypothetical protein